MSSELVGSDLTRAILERGNEQVWCAVSNDSEQDAMSTIRNVDDRFITHIVSFEEGCFLCKEGKVWQFAVPVKKIPLTQDEVGL